MDRFSLNNKPPNTASEDGSRGNRKFTSAG